MVITAAQNKCISEAAELFGNGIVTLQVVNCRSSRIPYDKIEDFRAYIAKEGQVTGTGSSTTSCIL